jgi:RNA polymerase sigma-70 factor (ECF subfamily)
MHPPPTPEERRLRFEKVYAANHDRILGYVRRRTESSHDAADVIAETFLTAWRRLDDVPRGDEARLWLYGVARRVLSNHHRGQRRRSALAADLGAQLRVDLAAVHRSPGHQDSELPAIAATFGDLPEGDRELLALVAWEGLDHGEIATVLGCSRNAVRIRLYRARRRFAHELKRRDAAFPQSQLIRTPASATNGERA